MNPWEMDWSNQQSGASQPMPWEQDYSGAQQAPQQNTVNIDETGDRQLPGLWKVNIGGVQANAVLSQRPDGRRVYLVRTDDGGVAKVMRNKSDGSLSLAPYTDKESALGSNAENFFAGAGKAVVDTGRGIGQLLGQVDQKTVDEAKARDAELMRSKAGIAGNIAGHAAMYALPAGAVTNSVRGAKMVEALSAVPKTAALLPAALGGAAYAGLQPVATGESRALNMAVGAAGGAAGDVLGRAVGAGVNRLAASRASAKAASEPVIDAANAAREAGFVISPENVNPGMLTNLASGVSGKIKTAQRASQINQRNTNDLVKQALGITEEGPLTADAINAVIKQAGKAYEDLANAGVISADGTFKAALDKAVSAQRSATSAFPGIVKSEALDVIDGLKNADQFSANDAIALTRVLRDKADAAYRSGATAEGRSFKDANKALEDIIERHLSASGQDGLLASFKQARQTIAKSKTALKAINPTTGDISAQVLAADLKKGKPLSGELLQIAQTAQAFPKSMQALKEAPHAYSPLDALVAVGSGAAGAAANPAFLAGAGLAASRPVVREAMLSAPMQAMMTKPTISQATADAIVTLGKSKAGQKILNSPSFLRFLAGSGAATGLASQH